jgi:hypothetical protein
VQREAGGDQHCLFGKNSLWTRLCLEVELPGNAQVRSFGENGTKPKGEAYTTSRGHKRVGCRMIYEANPRHKQA